MNQKKGQRTRSRKEVMAADPNCIYCGQPADKQEHMPPIIMFNGRDRPGGMEFATCAECNNGTSAADSVAAFLAKISFRTVSGDWTFEENRKQVSLLNELAPGFLDELFDKSRATEVTVPTNGGVLVRQTAINADGPITKGYVSVFAAKLAMALFREHIGKALPSEGGVQVWYYLNAGLTQATAKSLLSIMPLSGTLSAGRKTAGGQFQYRYNTNGSNVLAVLASFHNNLHVSFLASSEPELFNIPYSVPNTKFVRPGELMNLMPKSERSQFIQLPGLGGPPISIRRPARPISPTPLRRPSRNGS